MIVFNKMNSSSELNNKVETIHSAMYQVNKIMSKLDEEQKRLEDVLSNLDTLFAQNPETINQHEYVIA